MQFTIFKETHEELKAKMVDFAGFYMPVEYSGVIDEHITVREKAGLFDVSHMGSIWVKGQGALELLQYTTSNDVSALQPGSAHYTCFPNGKGGIVDDLLIYCYDEQKFLLVVNASNIQKDWEWINSQNRFGAILENSSANISQLALQGPLAQQIAQKLCDYPLENLGSFHFITTEFAQCQNVIISTTGYTGAGGYEIYFYNTDGLKIWKAIMEAGSEFGIKPIGLGARDTLRLEMGYCLYGNDIDDTTSPIEANLNWIVKFGKDFIDKEIHQTQVKEGVKRKLTGLKMIDRGVPRHGYEVYDLDKNLIGIVTSGGFSPCMKIGIAMAYINPKFNQAGQILFIKIRENFCKVEVCKFPFYKK